MSDNHKTISNGESVDYGPKRKAISNFYHF